MILGYKVHQLKVPISEQGTRKEKDMEDIYFKSVKPFVKWFQTSVKLDNTVYLFKPTRTYFAHVHKSPQHSVSFSMKCRNIVSSQINVSLTDWLCESNNFIPIQLHEYSIPSATAPRHKQIGWRYLGKICWWQNNPMLGADGWFCPSQKIYSQKQCRRKSFWPQNFVSPQN